VATETEAVIGPASTLSAPKSRRCDIYVYRYGNRPDHTHLDRSHEVPNTVHGRQESKAAPALSSRQLIAGEGSLGHLDRAGCGATEEKARTSASKVVDEKARNAAPAAKLRKLNTGSAGRFVATPIGDGADKRLRHAINQGLQRDGSSQFTQTANSGLAQVGTAGTGRYGSIISGSLEQSNVSIADQFTKMIVAQNAYQANSKSITTASEDMQTVIGLIR